MFIRTRVKAIDAHGQPRMSWTELSFLLELWGYRISTYVLLSTIDDPAWMAMMFC